MSNYPYSARDYGQLSSQQTPRSSRVIRTKTRKTVRLFRPETAPSSEEVGILKREKHNLLQEKSLLKAKISRLVDITKHPNRYTPKTNTDQNSLEREYRQVEQMSAAKRSEIAQMNSSDMAAVVEELQEECLMLYMELVRLKSEKQRTDAELKQATKQLQEARVQFSPDLERKQKKKINELQKYITEQKIRNAKIKAKLDEKENEQAENKQDEAQMIVEKTISDLEAQIKAEQDGIAEVEAEIRKLDEEKIKEINELQEKLSQI